MRWAFGYLAKMKAVHILSRRENTEGWEQALRGDENVR
jgi:hypothetical protein